MMLEYLTDEDLRARYPNDGFLLSDSDSVGAAIADTVAEAEGYLAGRYSLPLPAVPPVLVGRLCDMARYRLWREEASDEVPDGTVLRQMRRGFKLKDRLIRPASVIVSKGPATE